MYTLIFEGTREVWFQQEEFYVSQCSIQRRKLNNISIKWISKFDEAVKLFNQP